MDMLVLLAVLLVCIVITFIPAIVVMRSFDSYQWNGGICRSTLTAWVYKGEDKHGRAIYCTACGSKTRSFCEKQSEPLWEGD